jgi:hypothetical protein
MSGVVAGTMVQMRTLRRFSHYMVGELIAVPFAAARDLEAKRLAQPLQLFVPVPVGTTEDPAPARQAQPTGIVKK